IAAAFAYGRADIIVANIGTVLARMSPSPFQYLVTFDRAEAMRRFAGFAHRFHKTRDLVAFLGRLSAAISAHGSLGALFRKCYGEEDSDIGPSLARFVALLRHPERSEGPGRAGGAQTALRCVARPPRSLAHARDDGALQYLLTSPDDGSA